MNCTLFQRHFFRLKQKVWKKNPENLLLLLFPKLIILDTRYRCQSSFFSLRICIPLLKEPHTHTKRNFTVTWWKLILSVPNILEKSFASYFTFILQYMFSADFQVYSKFTNTLFIPRDDNEVFYDISVALDTIKISFHHENKCFVCF